MEEINNRVNALYGLSHDEIRFLTDEGAGVPEQHESED